jgi:hypothetical protein
MEGEERQSQRGVRDNPGFALHSHLLFHYLPFEFPLQGVILRNRILSPIFLG